MGRACQWMAYRAGDSGCDPPASVLWLRAAYACRRGLDVQVSIWLVRAIVSAVEGAGVCRDQFLAQARLDATCVEHRQSRLSVEDYVRVLETALDMSQDPALGLHLGEHANAGMYDVVAHLAQHAATLGEGIDMIVRYSGILASGFEPQLVTHGERVALRLPYLRGQSGAVRFTAEFAMTGLMRFLCSFVGESAQPLGACFAYAAPAHADEYRRVFAGAARFRQDFTEMRFPRAWLACAQPLANPDLHGALQSHAERALAKIERGGTTVDRVERVLAARRPRALPTMSDVARELDISARTLARRLQTEGASYAQLLDRRRTSAAKSLLEARRLTIQQVANAMGFADASAFHRAFRRWTGQTPMQYVASVAR